MSFKKKMLAVAAAGALSALAAVPAMAFENEFHGTYSLKYFLSNVDNYRSAVIDPTKYTDDNKTNNYFEQRARLMYIAKASDDLKLVTHFELDTKFGGMGGAANYKGSVNGGDTGQLDADSLILEAKNIYLDFNLGKNVNVKTGVQPFKDSFKGILLDADVAGVSTTSKIGSNVVLGVGYYRLIDSIQVAGNNTTGQANLDFAAVDVKYNLNKDTSFGAAYYLVADYRNKATTYTITDGTTSSDVALFGTNAATSLISANTGGAAPGTEMVHTFGLYGNGKIGPVAVSGFGAMQVGQTSGPTKGNGQANIHKSGYAANVAAKLPLGPGTAKAAYLFVSGDDKRDNTDTAWYGVQNGSLSVTSYNESGMMLLNRNALSQGGSTDRNIIYNMGGNNAPGFHLVSLGYDATITPKAFANANLGMAWVAKNTAAKNGSNLIGTEVNLEAGYKVYDNLTAKVQAAYVVLGGLYDRTAENSLDNAVTPENPYTARICLTYAF